MASIKVAVSGTVKKLTLSGPILEAVLCSSSSTGVVLIRRLMSIDMRKLGRCIHNEQPLH